MKSWRLFDLADLLRIVLVIAQYYIGNRLAMVTMKMLDILIGSTTKYSSVSSVYLDQFQAKASMSKHLIYHTFPRTGFTASYFC